MLLKKLFRTLWKYKAQFISMVIMVALVEHFKRRHIFSWPSRSRPV